MDFQLCSLATSRANCQHDHSLHLHLVTQRARYNGKKEMAEARREIIKQVYENPRTGFGNLEETFRQARARDPNITRGEVREYLHSLIVRQDRPERGYNGFVPPEPMFQLQVDLADMTAFAQGPKFKDSAPKRSAEPVRHYQSKSKHLKGPACKRLQMYSYTSRAQAPADLKPRSTRSAKGRGRISTSETLRKCKTL